MNNFKIQSLVLTAVIAMVYATPVKPPHNITLLGHIRDDADTLLEKGLNFHVGWPAGIDTTCVKEFFCFAEKSLEEAKNSALSNLTRHLKKYNKDMKITCNPTFGRKFNVIKLLKSIKTCATP